MDRRGKEERPKQWEAVVEAAERREEEIRSGKKGKGLNETLSLLHIGRPEPRRSVLDFSLMRGTASSTSTSLGIRAASPETSKYLTVYFVLPPTAIET
jgi:hypothetical protein